MSLRQLMLTDRRIRQRDHLLEIVRALTQQLDPDEVLRRILTAAADMLGARAGLIVLREGLNPATLTGGGPLRVRAYYQVNPEFLRDLDGLLLDIHKEAPLSDVVSEIIRRLRLVSNSRDYTLPATIGLPLMVANTLIGVLLVFRNYAAPFGPDERKVLQSFADQAAIAVQNARLYEQAVSEQRRLDAILDGSADGILIMDAAHKIMRWNRALARLTGLPGPQAVGQTHDDLINWAERKPGPDLEEAEANGWPLAQTSTLYVEGDLKRSDGTTVAVGITYAPIFGDRTQLVNIVANIRDITHFREAEELKSTFISVISHELKTPVSLIKGYANTLRRPDAKWNKQTIEDSLEVIEEEADRLAALIENLLDASRLQAGGLVLERNAVMLDRLASDLAEKFAIQTDRHQIKVDFSDNFPAVIGDEERLLQVFTNLLSNAIKYSPQGGDIVIAGTAQPSTVTISISDNGPGIPSYEIDRVFDRFHRAKTPDTARTAGAGLGLYLARELVTAHNGLIWVESQPGQGATFYVQLPRPESD